MTGNDQAETRDYRDGQLVLAARCTECDWELGTDEPSTWSLVEQFRHAENVTHRSLQDFDENDFAANQLAYAASRTRTNCGTRPTNDDRN